MSMRVLAVQSPIEAICGQLAEEPVHPGRRTIVLVASERQAHAIRRHLGVELARPECLAGVLLVRPVEFARDLLGRAGCVRLPGWEEMRRLRILELFESEALAASLRYFNGEQLRCGQGYVDAFARTIADLEASGLTAALMLLVSDHLGNDDPLAAARLRDVAVTWQAADAHQGLHASTAQLFTQAATTIAAQPALAAPFGRIFAVLTTSPSAVLVRFLGALPKCVLVFHDARPLRSGTQRWRALLGVPGAPEHDAAGVPEGLAATLPDTTWASSELRLVQRFLFERPEVLTDPQRPRSRGADGTVDLEEHASIEDEIEAAAGWVGEQIAEGTPLEHLALIVPEIDPYAAALVDRVQRLGHRDDDASRRVHVAGGLSLVMTPAGLRLQAVLHALARGLDAEATIRVLPTLRRAEQAQDDPHARLTPSRAAEIVYAAGILGGSTGDPQGVCEWSVRLGTRRNALRTLLAADAGTASESDQRRGALERSDAQRWLRDIEPILPAIEALQHLAEEVLGGAPLETLWSEMRAFGDRWLRMPPDPPNLLAILGQRLQPILASPVAHSIRGAAALRCIMDLLQQERWQTARFGEPCVFVGTPAQAAGIPFAAVRILGLAEGALPHTPHDDPIVPDALRGRMEAAASALEASGIVVARLADHVLDDLHGVYRVVSGVRQRLALSVPRQWVDRSDREVSGVLLEAATALGRPAEHGAGGGDVPTAARLRAVYLNAGRDARTAAAVAQPVLPRALLTAIVGSRPSTTAGSGSAGVFAVPTSWTGQSVLAVDRVWELQHLEQAALGAPDGIVSDTWHAIVPPGLTPKRPISATGLLSLLRCPHRFLLERILYFKEPPERPPTDVIPPVQYGALFHAAAERFFAEAGVPLCRGEATLEHWLARARAFADEEFDARRHTYPLRSPTATDHERARLLRQIEQLVRYEWQAARREFVASELTFGEPEPIALEVDGGILYLRGAIDRVDQVGPATLSVRDLKTGRVRDLNEEAVNTMRDLQIGLYVLVLEAARAAAGDSTRVARAAYVHPSAAQEPDRAFDGAGLELLRRHTRQWLGVARQLLSTGSFPHTPNAEDCTFCPFVAACGDDAQGRSQRKLAVLPAGHVLEPFALLKRQCVTEDA